MAVLTPGQVFVTTTPVLRVENQLKPGTWRFRLIVVDDAGQASAPVELRVEVRPDQSASTNPS